MPRKMEGSGFLLCSEFPVLRVLLLYLLVELFLPVILCSLNPKKVVQVLRFRGPKLQFLLCVVELLSLGMAVKS